MTNGKHMRIGFLLFPGFPMACLTSMIEPFRAANEISGQDMFSWTLVSETGMSVEASAMVGFDPSMSLEEVEGLDQLFLLSAPASRFDNPTASDGKLRKLGRHGMTIGAISGGVFPLARAGLLEGAQASVHWCYASAFEAEFPLLDATDDVIALDGRRVTASGAAAAFDLALHMIEAQLGADVATEVACWFQPVNMADVADCIGVSVRQMERMFKKTTGKSPLHYYRAIRMKAARQLVLYSKDTMTEIALSVGYASATPMIQNYEEVFGVHPSADREKINMFRVRENAIVPSA